MPRMNIERYRCDPDEFIAACKATKLPFRKIAMMIGVSQQTIYRWKQKIGAPPPKMALMLVKIIAAKRQALITGQAPQVEL